VFALVLGCATGPIARSGLQRQLDEAPAGGTVRLGAGEWRGDLHIRKALTLRGDPVAATILSGNLVIEARGVTLEKLRVVGAPAALSLTKGGSATLRSVDVESQGIGLDLAEGSTAIVEDSSFRCAANERPGTAVRVRGLLNLARTEVGGKCRRGVDVDRGVAELHRLTVHGPEEAGVHGIDCQLRLSDLAVDTVGEKGAGLFAARGRIDATNLHMQGGEEGVLLRDSQARLEGLRAEGNRMAALALIGGAATLTEGRLTGPFHEGALSALDGSVLTAAKVRIEAAGVAGLFAVGARVDVSSMEVEGPRTDGDGDYGHGFVLTRSRGTLRDIRVTDAEGAAVYVTNETSAVDVDGCQARSLGAGVVSTMHAHVRTRNLEVADGLVGLLAMRGGEIDTGDGTLRAATGVATCAGSVVKETGRLILKSTRPRVSCGEADGGVPWHRVFEDLHRGP
jgi:hypothetical protein